MISCGTKIKTNIKFGYAPALEQMAKRLVPSTVTIIRKRHPDLSSLDSFELSKLAEHFRLSPSLTKRQIEVSISGRSSSRSTASWIMTERGERVLGCRHGCYKEPGHLTLPNGKRVAESAPTFTAYPHKTDGGLDTDTAKSWTLEIDRARFWPMTDPVADLAIFNSVAGPYAPTDRIPLADNIPGVGAEIVRIGREGRVITGRLLSSGDKTEKFYYPENGESDITQFDLDSYSGVTVAGKTIPGDSGGPMLTQDGKLFSVTTGFHGYNGVPVRDSAGRVLYFHNPFGIAGTGAKGPNAATIHGFLWRNGLQRYL